MISIISAAAADLGVGQNDFDININYRLRDPGAILISLLNKNLTDARPQRQRGRTAGLILRGWLVGLLRACP